VIAPPELDAVRPPADGTGGAGGTGGGEPGRLGLVSLVGAGPGDPELLTLKASRRIAEADAVVYDRLVDRRVMALAPPGATLHDAGKRGHEEAVEQAETTELLVRLGRAGLRVVRLKGGDPFVFGRGGEEASALAAAGIPFEVVPGVTSGIAGPAYAGIPVTDRRFSRSVAFVTGHDLGFETGSQTPRPGTGAPEIDWAAIASIDTVVVFMAGRAADRIARELLAAGRPGATPVAFIRSATTDRQETSLLDLATLAREGIGTMDERPALLVVGDVVGLAPSLAWFAPGALAGADAEVGAGVGRPDIPPLLFGPLPHSLAQSGPHPAAPSENRP
jgi:uroporphyrin-III C-methyltransferase